MDCAQWKDEWIARLYEELDPAEQRSVDEHVRGCVDCARRLDDLSACRVLLQEAAGAAPAVPATPRLLVLQRPPRTLVGFTFAAGLAAAATVFGLGVFAGVQFRPAGTRADPGTTASGNPTPDHAVESTRALESRLEGLERRLAGLETSPGDPAGLTREQLRGELARLEDRFDRRRAGDLDYLVKSITATEVRTGAWIDRTNEALEYLALLQDPRVRQH